MQHINYKSLAETVDSVAEALFFSREISLKDQLSIGKWLASRQGLPGSYAGMITPTAADTKSGVRVFTGERIISRAAIAHILGEESSRLLSIFKLKNREVRDAQDRAMAGFCARLEQAEKDGYNTGTYCCGRCTVAYWRNMLVTKIPKREERLAEGMKELKRSRLGNGNWRRFPFYYLSLALIEIGPELAKAEMQYAAPVWEKYLKRSSDDTGKYGRRRTKIGRELLKQC